VRFGQVDVTSPDPRLSLSIGADQSQGLWIMDDDAVVVEVRETREVLVDPPINALLALGEV
jgi:hypothetical protein